MSNAIRNSLILGLLLVLISVSSYYFVIVRKSEQIEELTVIVTEKEEEFENLRLLADQYETFVDSLNALKEEFENRDKVLPFIEDSRISYEYFTKLASESDSYVNFTFQGGNQTEYDEFIITNYTLEGDAPFRNLYNFIWKLENYKRLYNIVSVNFEEITKLDEDNKNPQSVVGFNIALTGYSSRIKPVQEEVITDTLSVSGYSSNPFNPLVREQLPPNTENLLVVDDAELKGLTQDRAFIVGDDGELLVMRPGDRVYLGRLTRIDVDNNLVEFTLNKGGFVETVIIRLKR